MTLSEVCDRYPALIAYHGGTLTAFQTCLRRTASRPGRQAQRRTGHGSGQRVDYQPWQVRVLALRLLIARLLPGASIDDNALRNAEWSAGFVRIDLAHHAFLSLHPPQDVWADLWPSDR